MAPSRTANRLARGVLMLAGAAAATYGAYVASAWLRYGRAPGSRNEDADPLLDLFMPRYDIAERHRIGVDAPAEATFDACLKLDLEDSALIRGIFRGREVLLGADPGTTSRRQTLVERTKALGWVVLAEVPGHEIVMGAVTRPWEANVVFRGLPAHEFAAFDEPGYVKIVWTLGADAAGSNASVARTETRAIATDAGARRKFRWYWAQFSPGILLIRQVALRMVKAQAEQSARAARTKSVAPISAPAAK
jgi:hypothetical protein